MAKRTICAAAIAFSTATTGLAETMTTLSLSHQWPTSDPRHQAAQMLADTLYDRDIGIDVRIHPSATLMSPMEQYDALSEGELAFAVMPLAYAAERRPQYKLTVLPGFARDHDHAERLTRSDFMNELEAILAKDGIVVIAHGFLASGLVGRENCTSGEERTFSLFDALPVGLVEGSSNPNGNFVDDGDLFERVACYTAPGQTLPSIVYQPVLMSAVVFDTLSEKQQDVVRDIASSVQTLYRTEAELQDRLTLAAFRDAGVLVREMLPDEFEAWRSEAWSAAALSLASDPASVRLLDLALAVE